MASPFPGMDPYLEGEMWQEFHERLSNQISRQLMPLLAPKYVALLARRHVMQTVDLAIVGPGSNRTIYPDVHITQVPQRLREEAGGGVLTEPAVELASPMIERVPLTSVEIRDVAERRLVTLIEILSPANKQGEGARDYNLRRLDILQTSAHLLEVDLLRQGERLSLHGKLPPAPYYVFLSRAQQRPRTQVWPVGLREVLPTVPAPLLFPDPDVPLDLQFAVRACFELVRYERLLDYGKPPPRPVLNEADAEWVRKRLDHAGIP